MKEFTGKVAVITGGASGIGRALAERSAREGMKVVLADIEEAALARAESELKAEGASVLAVRTDVSKLEDVRALADRTLSAFGAVHLLCNNAGVSAGNSILTATIADWKWVLGVNLWGVVHGVHVFLPIMIDQDTEGHVVNTASIAGLISGPGLGVYKVSKHGIVTLSETLYHELKLTDAKVKVSVLCPRFVKTNLGGSGRNRPPELISDPADGKGEPDARTMAEVRRLREINYSEMDPSEVADHVFKAVRDETFYILTHAATDRPRVEARMMNILYGLNPAAV